MISKSVKAKRRQNATLYKRIPDIVQFKHFPNVPGSHAWVTSLPISLHYSVHVESNGRKARADTMQLIINCIRENPILRKPVASNGRTLSEGMAASEIVMDAVRVFTGGKNVIVSN